jgi:hypothetical protein
MNNLKKLWKNKTKHGAHKQKFGDNQERILEKIVKKYVPKKERPLKEKPLQMDSKFITYCKAITWNAGKAIGRKITREIGLRSTMASLSEHDYLM